MLMYHRPTSRSTQPGGWLRTSENGDASSKRKHPSGGKVCSVLFFSLAVLDSRVGHTMSHGRTFSIYICPLSFWLTFLRIVLSKYWCCPSRPCGVFVRKTLLFVIMLARLFIDGKPTCLAVFAVPNASKSNFILLVQEPIFKRGPNKGVGATPTTHLVCHFRLLGGCLWNISSPVVELNCGNTKKL